MKIITSLIIVLMYSGCLFAAPRTPKQAMLIAKTFVNSNVQMQHVSTTGLSVAKCNSAVARSVDSNPAYYIINAADNAGFVIVSGDDCVREVLAYSNKGNLDYNNLPDNAKYWLDFYAEEIKQAVSNGVQTEEYGLEMKASKPVIEPLLGDIEWNQDEPYNLRCPVSGGKRTVTGCGATAMAMVMKYYGYPQRGIGSKNYTTATLNLAVGADFANTTYKWDKMLPQYSGVTATDEQKNAVAELMYHCGVAMDMDYGTGASGAGVFTQYGALINNFGYNPNMYFLGRDFTTAGQWENQILQELESNRPVLYSGQGTSGGHSFVCDGSDGEGKYHFNWGWDGYANGYYALSALEPGTGGIGAGAGSYNQSQYILCGAQPAAMTGRVSGFSSEGTATASKTSYSRNENVVVTFTNIYNLTSSFDGVYGLALYKGDEFVTFLTEPEQSTASIGMGWSSNPVSGVVPGSVPNGSYQLYFASQDKRDTAPTKLRGMANTVLFYNVEVSNSNITLTKPTSNVSLVQVTKTELVGTANAGSDMTFRLQMRNDGPTYADELGVYITAGRLSANKARISQYVVLPGYSTTTVTITGNPNLPVGKNYYAVGSYRSGDNWTEFTNTQLRLYFDIEEAETGINDITAETDKDMRIFNVNGQYVGTDLNALDKGLYIVNGRKVVKQ